MPVINRPNLPPEVYIVDDPAEDRREIEIGSPRLVRRAVRPKSVMLENSETHAAAWLPLKALAPSSHPDVFALRRWFKPDAKVEKLFARDDP